LSYNQGYSARVDQQQTDTGTGPSTEIRPIESSLKSLWERARKASEAIHTLREERKLLLAKVEDLLRENQRLQQDVVRKDQLLKSATASAQEVAAKKTGAFPDGEREVMVARIKTLLAKLDTYL